MMEPCSCAYYSHLPNYLALKLLPDNEHYEYDSGAADSEYEDDYYNEDSGGKNFNHSWQICKLFIII